MNTTAGAAPLPRGVTGPIPREVLRLALPVLVSQLLRIAYQWVDAVWVRGLGVEATAAVTTSMFVMWSVYALGDIFGAGVSAYVSQLLGAGEWRRAGLAAYKGLRATAIIGVGISVLGAIGARRVYELMHATPGVVDNGTHYLAVIAGAAVLPMLASNCEAVMRASGNTRLTMVLDVGAVGLNIVLAPFLIYGLGPFPRLGIAGAAWATVIAEASLLACYAWLILRRHPAFPFARSSPGYAVRTLALGRVGLPVALVSIMFSLVYVAFARAAAQFGSASLAVLGMANRIEALQFVVASSIGIGCATLVGQNIGGQRPERVEQAIRLGLTWSLSLSVVLTVLMLAWPTMFLMLSTRDAEALRIGVPYLRILATCLLATSIEMVIAEAVLHSGHTRVVSMLYNGMSLIRIPLAFWLPSVMHNGVLGIAWLITITCNLRTIAIVVWAARGHWKAGLGAELQSSDPGHGMLAGPATPSGVMGSGGATESSAEPPRRGDTA